MFFFPRVTLITDANIPVWGHLNMGSEISEISRVKVCVCVCHTSRSKDFSLLNVIESLSSGGRFRRGKANQP